MNAPYQVVLDAPVERFLDRLGDAILLRRFRNAIEKLRLQPRPPGCKKMEGFHNTYRVRVGDWRIIYEVLDRQLLVTVIRIGNRGSVY